MKKENIILTISYGVEDGEIRVEEKINKEFEDMYLQKAGNKFEHFLQDMNRQERKNGDKLAKLIDRLYK